jgi:hypothetical protein
MTWPLRRQMCARFRTSTWEPYLWCQVWCCEDCHVCGFLVSPPSIVGTDFTCFAFTVLRMTTKSLNWTFRWGWMPRCLSNSLHSMDNVQRTNKFRNFFRSFFAFLFFSLSRMAPNPSPTHKYTPVCILYQSIAYCCCCNLYLSLLLYWHYPSIRYICGWVYVCLVFPGLVVVSVVLRTCRPSFIGPTKGWSRRRERRRNRM